jgi:1,2-diacylglycerol 3-alpha-glucosyltransferase
MKILFGAETYYPNVNGASYFAQRLAFYLKERGHDVLVIAPSRKFYDERYEHNGIEILGLKSFPVLVTKFRLAFPFLVKKTIDPIISDFKPDVIHIHGHFFIQKSIFKSGKKKNIPIVATNHFMPENISHFFPFPQKIIQWMVGHEWKKFKKVFENADIVTTPTETAALALKKINLSKPIMAISCGVDLKKFNPDNDIMGLKEKYKIPDKPVLIYVGRLDSEKKLDFIISSFKQALQKIDVHLVICGNGAEKEKLINLTRQLGLEKNITFTGFIPDADLPGIYCLADCFVIASIAELQSIVTMEALASGLPVLAVNAMALPELVNDGYNGFLFKISDISGLAEKIIKIFTDDNLRKTMAGHSLEIIRKHDINKTVDEYEAIYRGLIKAHE